MSVNNQTKKSVGIVTLWWSNDNYGQLLQCFAIQQFLKSLGFEAFLIKYDMRLDREENDRLLRVLKRFKLFFVFRLLKTIRNNIRDKKNKLLYKYKSERGFEEFRDRYIESTEQKYSQQMLIDNPPQADIYVAGSDQIWSSPNDIFFLNFGDKNILRVSFSASFGFSPNCLNPAHGDKYKVLLSNMDFISLRERDGIEICNSLGFENTHLFLDPTMMISRSSYDSISSPIKTKERFCFVYMLESPDLTPVSMPEINNYVEKERGLEVLYVASQDRNDKYKKKSPTINRFLTYIRESDFVITNSFHGAVFSIIYNKPFAVIPKGNKTNGRVHTLLERFGLRSCVCSDIKEVKYILDNFNSMYNYTLVNMKLEEEKEFVRTMFLKSITERVN